MSAMIIHKEYFHHYSMTFIKDNSNLTITKSSNENSIKFGSTTEQALETTSLNPTDMIRKESVLPCPPIPPQLQGKVVLNMNSTSWSNLSSDLSDVHILSGGEFTPNCSTEHRGSLEKKILLGLSNTLSCHHHTILQQRGTPQDTSSKSSSSVVKTKHPLQVSHSSHGHSPMSVKNLCCFSGRWSLVQQSHALQCRLHRDSEVQRLELLWYRFTCIHYSQLILQCFTMLIWYPRMIATSTPALTSPDISPRQWTRWGTSSPILDCSEEPPPWQGSRWGESMVSPISGGGGAGRMMIWPRDSPPTITPSSDINLK